MIWRETRSASEQIGAHVSHKAHKQATTVQFFPFSSHHPSFLSRGLCFIASRSSPDLSTSGARRLRTIRRRSRPHRHLDYTPLDPIPLSFLHFLAESSVSLVYPFSLSCTSHCASPNTRVRMDLLPTTLLPLLPACTLPSLRYLIFPPILSLTIFHLLATLYLGYTNKTNSLTKKVRKCMSIVHGRIEPI